MKKFIGLLLSVLVASVLTTGCKENDPAALGAAMQDDAQCTPLSYGEHVAYFPCVGAAFGRALEKFMKLNAAEWDVQALTGNGTGGYGHDLGYWIVMNKRQ